jgi:hypothetical protein
MHENLNVEIETEPQKEYWQEIEDIENKLFPECAAEEGIVITAKDERYFYFKPSYFFRVGLFSKDDVSSLIEKNKKILTVGSGSALLEKILVNLGVPEENICISDISEESMPKDFKHYVFDMHNEWPKIEDLFDLIIIPESFGVSVLESTLGNEKLLENEFLRKWKEAEFLKDVIVKATKYLKENGKIQVVDPCVDDERIIENLREMLPQDLYEIQDENGKILTIRKVNKK